MDDNKKFAILIDADNISSKYISAVIDEITSYGIATYRRIYGDWTSTQAKSWKKILAENSIIPIQQFNNTIGKNSTDSALIIDAMDILYTGNVDGFCIVSSDGDFTRLAARLRESGMMVVGMGEKKTPSSFRSACSKFTVLENLTDEEDMQSDSAKPEVMAEKISKVEPTVQNDSEESVSTSRETIESVILSIITENENNGNDTELGALGNRLVNKYPDFDVRNYGYSLLSKFLEGFPNLELIKNNTSVTVRIKASNENKLEASEYIKSLVINAGAKGIGVSEVGNKLHKSFSRFNIKDYGYSKFTKFLQDIDGIELYEDAAGQKRCGVSTVK